VSESARASERDRAAPIWQLLLLLTIAALILVSAFPYFEQTRNANELPRLVQAMARVEAGEWAIDGPSRRGIPLGPDIARSPVDDRLYPNKPPGTSVVGTLAFRAASVGATPPTLREFTWWARLFAGVIPALVLLGIAWGRLRELGHGGPVVNAVLLAWLFGTPMFAYARLFYGHALAACLLYAGLVALARGHARKRAWTSALGGLLAATAITVEYGAAFAGLPIAIALAIPVFDRRGAATLRRHALVRAGVALMAALIPVLLLALYQRSVFGSVLSTGYHFAADPGFRAAHGQGLLGLGWPRVDKIGIDLLSPKTGLLVFSPLVLVGLAGLVHAARRTGPRAWAARLDLAVFACLLLVGLGLGFEGGWRIGPRYLVIALPCLLLGLAEAIEAWRDGPVFAGVWAVALTWSVLACSLAATLWPHVDPTNIGEPFGEVFLALIRDGYGPYGLPQWISPGMGSVLALALPFVLAVGVNVWALGPRRVTVLLPMLVGVLMGLLIVLVILPRIVVAPLKSERNLRYIELVYEPKVQIEPEGSRLEPGHTITLD